MTDATQDLALSDPAPTGDVDENLPGVPQRRTFWGDAWRILRKSPLFWIALVLIIVFVTMAIAPQIYTSFAPGPPSPSGRYCNLADARQPPSAEHWYGTDTQGCDYYTQVTYGAQVSMRVAVGATIVTLAVGLTLGGITGYYGGLTDTVISRLADGFFALPYLVGAIIVLSVIATPTGRTEWHVLIAIAFLSWPGLLRLYRSTVLQVRGLEYVQAARAIGSSDRRIIWRHILPNAVAPVIVYSTVSMGAIIGVEATLSFLGIGLPINSVSWGNMIAAAQGRVQNSPFLIIFPGLYLALASLGFVMMGEQLREALDPRLR